MDLSNNPTRRELAELLAVCDDEATHHVVWVSNSGRVSITPLVPGMASIDVRRRPDFRFQYETLIGRGGDAQIDVNDELVSKRHCLIRVEGPVCTIQDLGSRNGTCINGRKMQDERALRLRHLDEIQVGTTRLFVLHGAFKRFTPR